MLKLSSQPLPPEIESCTKKQSIEPEILMKWRSLRFCHVNQDKGQVFDAAEYGGVHLSPSQIRLLGCGRSELLTSSSGFPLTQAWPGIERFEVCSSAQTLRQSFVVAPQLTRPSSLKGLRK